MKKGSTPQLSASWWRAEAPECLGTAKELEKALADAESALKAAQKGPEAKSVEAAGKAIQAVEAAVKKTQAEAEKLLKSPPKDPKKARFVADEVQFTVDALKKFPKLLDAARGEAESLLEGGSDEDDGEEDEKSLLTDDKAYKAYLTRLLRQAQKGPLNFAIGLGRKPAESRMLLHRTRSGKSLVTGIRDETDLKKFAFGRCEAQEDPAGVLVLLLEGTLASGLARKTERLFQAFKPQPFKKVVLRVDGQEVPDQLDAEDLAEEYQTIKAELYPALSAAVREPVHFKDDIVEKMGLADKAANAKDFAEGIRLYEALREWLDNPPPAPTVPSPPGPPTARTPLQSSEDLLLAFNERLKGLLPLVKAAAGQAAGDAARLKLSEAGVFARKQDFATATTLLDEAEALLKRAGHDGNDTPTVDPSAAFNERLKALLPRIKEAAGQPGGDDARLKASEAGVFARKQDFDQAHALLDEVEQLLAGPRQTTPPGPRQRTDGGVEITERLKALMPGLKALAGTPQGDELRLMLSEAGVFARQKAFDQASALLDRAEQLLAGSPGESPSDSKKSPPVTGLDPSAFRERWESARADLAEAVERSVAQLEALARVLQGTEDENLVWVAEEGINQVAGLLRAGLSDVERTGSKNPAALADKARPAINGFRRRLKDPRVVACDDNQFGVAVAVASTVDGALQALETVLADVPAP